VISDEDLMEMREIPDDNLEERGSDDLMGIQEMLDAFQIIFKKTLNYLKSSGTFVGYRMDELPKEWTSKLLMKSLNDIKQKNMDSFAGTEVMKILMSDLFDWVVENQGEIKAGCSMREPSCMEDWNLLKSEVEAVIYHLIKDGMDAEFRYLNFYRDFMEDLYRMYFRMIMGDSELKLKLGIPLKDEFMKLAEKMKLYEEIKSN
jgi:hypothetical protein